AQGEAVHDARRRRAFGGQTGGGDDRRNGVGQRDVQEVLRQQAGVTLGNHMGVVEPAGGRGRGRGVVVGVAVAVGKDRAVAAAAVDDLDLARQGAYGRVARGQVDRDAGREVAEQEVVRGIRQPSIAGHGGGEV